MPDATMREGVIIKGVGGFYEVWLPETDTRITCKAKGIFRKEGMTPLTGDRVMVEPKPAIPGQGFLCEILPRRNLFIRPPVANMEQMAIVLSAGAPDPDLYMTDKLLIACEMRDIRPLLILNKADVAEPERVRTIHEIYAASGYPLLLVSCLTGEGMDALRAATVGIVTALSGQSGVGKSTLLNALSMEERMETGTLSEKVRRGKHTTRHAELLHLPGHGWICDTAGFSQYELDTVPFDALDQYYPEFEPERGQCRFQGCSHLNEPDCALRRKLEAGEIAQKRFDTYVAFYTELKERHQNRYR